MSATRPWVDAFADAMEAKLDANRDKGDRNGWRKEQAAYLRRCLLNEVAELFHEMDTHGVPGTASQRKARIVSECADVANFAMMIADVAGGMKAKP